MIISCAECVQPFQDSQSVCPHCGRPSLFPNVAAAQREGERIELERRYWATCADLDARECNSVRIAFEEAVVTCARVVVATGFWELERLARADTNVFSTFYLKMRAGLQLPTGSRWEVLRAVAEEAAFPGFAEHVRYGVLSLNEYGLLNYGDCFLLMKQDMVAHRTSLFEDNNVVLTVYEQGLRMADAISLPAGHRAIWAERHRLCLAKLGHKLRPETAADDFARLLLENGHDTGNDRFVEAHIWGTFTIRSVEKVRIRRRRGRPFRASIADVERILQQYGIPIETI